MAGSPMTLTRRTLNKTLATLALGAASGLTLGTTAIARTPDDIARDLQRDLTRAFADVQAGQSFSIASVEVIEPQPGAIGGTRLRTVVELTWRPGYRRHPFGVEASSLDAAYDAVLAAAIARLTPAFHPPRARP